MEYTELGKTGLRVSRVCFGTWQFGGEWGAVERDDAKDAIRRALDLGVTFFDTAQAYGFGDSEALLAEGLGDDIKRDDIVVATKGGLRPVDDAVERDAGRNWLREGVEQSLEHLGVEAIDLYQLHWPDPETPVEETGQVLAELKQEGKIRHVGVSNFDADQMQELSEHIEVETLQPPYHLFRREVERETLPWCRENDIGVLAYGPLAHGLLSGNIDRDWQPEDDDWRADSELFQGEEFERNIEAVEQLKSFAEERALTVPQLAVAWVLANPAVDAAIVGVRRPDHIEGTAPAGDVQLSPDDLQEIDQIMEPASQVAGPTPEG